MSLLSLDGLVTEFGSGASAVRAVNGLNLEIQPGEIVALVGESGCGKSATSYSISGLLPEGRGRVKGGTIKLNGREIQNLPERKMRKIRGREISMIFQEPMTALNPTMTIGAQVAEPLEIHYGLSPRVARARALDILRQVNLPYPEDKMRAYPHQLSGGQRQRVVIALALIAEPQLIIADEPTTALDVTVQAQILSVLREINERNGTAILLITHDFGVVAEIAHRVVVMYAGYKVEEGRVEDIFDRPRHPYTKALLASMPRLGTSLTASQEDEHVRIAGIPGIVEHFEPGRRGCIFSGRCEHATEFCFKDVPPLSTTSENQSVACHNSEEPE
ncbi:ABC transporter ATP-binding protein [Celeribacter persicus]|uniref:Peptide/nickel transport system ATP-binding protein n=1 Tax=Celeribacter persicus TaxID=1651082 RepID=A0A2T5HUM9_9RHOB|nr:ABC transporter ATP-binding protein [Celeribacter persicus]PTQ75299.1 peptide/nickel transport system ATP-binding protein [Celeribacter persicus]